MLETCLQFSHPTKYTTKNFNKYIYGSKAQMEILNLHTMRIIFLKVYPLIHSLFYNHSYNYQLADSEENNILSKKKNIIPVQILFATTTESLNNIVEEAASFCGMPFATNRWLNGSLTASINNFTEVEKSQNNRNVLSNQNFKNRFKKTRYHYQVFNTRYFQLQRPSLIVLPDVSNNSMIWQEAKAKDIPVLGLLNTSSALELDYAIFGDDKSPYIVSFFCNLIAVIIEKELIAFKHKQEILATFRLKTEIFFPIKSNKLWLKYNKKKKQLIKDNQKVYKEKRNRNFFKYFLRSYVRTLVKKRIKEVIPFNQIRETPKKIARRYLQRLVRKINSFRYKILTDSKKYTVYKPFDKKIIKFVVRKKYFIQRLKNRRQTFSQYLLKKEMLRVFDSYSTLKNMRIVDMSIKYGLINLYKKWTRFWPEYFWDNNPYHIQRSVFWYGRKEYKLTKYKAGNKRRAKSYYWRHYWKLRTGKQALKKITPRVDKKKTKNKLLTLRVSRYDISPLQVKQFLNYNLVMKQFRIRYNRYKFRYRLKLSPPRNKPLKNNKFS